MSTSIDARLPETPLTAKRRVATQPSTVGTSSSGSIDPNTFTPFTPYSRAASSAFVTPVHDDDASTKRILMSSLVDSDTASSSRQKTTRTSIADISANWRAKARIAGIRISSDSDSAAELPLLRSPAFISNDRRLARSIGRPDLFNGSPSMPSPLTSSRKSRAFLTPSKNLFPNSNLDALPVIADDADEDSCNFDEVFLNQGTLNRTSSSSKFFIRMDEQPQPQRQAKSPRSRTSPPSKSSPQSAECTGCSSQLRISVFEPCQHAICHTCFTGILNIADQKRLECPVCCTPVVDFTLAPAKTTFASPSKLHQPIALGLVPAATKPSSSPAQDARRRPISTSRAPSMTTSSSRIHLKSASTSAAPVSEPSVIRVDNLPWDVTPSMLSSWLDLSFIAIHILLDRGTGKTLSHCLIELSQANARLALRTCQNKIIGEGRRRRAVSVTMSGQAELMREIFPTWRGSFEASRPSVQGLDQRRIADAINVGLLTEQELDGLMKLVETPNSHFLKVPTLPYHALISIMQKFPVALDSRVFWTNDLRDRLFGIVKSATQVLSTRVTQEGWDGKLMDELVSTGVSCVAFTDVQRRLIAVAALPDTNTCANTPNTPYVELASDSDSDVTDSPPNISEPVTPAEHINDLQTGYFTAQNSTHPNRRSSMFTGVARCRVVQIMDPVAASSLPASELPRSLFEQISDDVGVDAALVRMVWRKFVEAQG
ncbi:hypothetical protein FRB95_006790 [Tulasnella sp. JGI-2019a]|nr:hypothetical protein FRB95_006790 [Tulasnella sp. JGI-2019a]